MAPRGRRTGTLPSELTSFADRSDELAEVRRLPVASGLRPVTGMGGVGKTRLALRKIAGCWGRPGMARWLSGLLASVPNSPHQH
jgi:hypothetical protein